MIGGAGIGAGRALTLLGLVALIATGCNNGERKPANASNEATKVEPASAPLPSDPAEFLAELMPLPGGVEALEIRYAVTGPALEGELTILIGEGGNKREQWELRTIGAAEALHSRGLAITNPKQIWHAPEGEVGELRSNSLGALADAWMALDEPRRAAVVHAIREWHELLGKRRAEVPGDQSEILGVACLQTRIAAQNLCMWEAVGLFLRYEGSAFSIEASAIDRAPTLPADAFELPAEASAAPPQAAPPQAAPPDFAEALDEAAQGNAAALFLLVSRTQALPKLAPPKQAAAPPSPDDSETGDTETGA